MIIQYIIIGLILTVAIVYIAISTYKTIKRNLLCKDYRCAGCAFYDTCKRKKKKRSKKFGRTK
jgi:hypothetical protein